MATDYASGSLKIPGLGNGTNWGEMLDKLQQIEMRHAMQLGRWREDWQKRLDAFDTLGMALTEYSSALKSMNSEDKFLVKNVSSSNEFLASIRASGTAAEGSYTLEVNQLASNSYASLVFNLASKSDVVYSGVGMGQFSFTLGGTAHTLDVPTGTTLEGLKTLLNNKYGKPSGGGLGLKATVIDVGGKQMLQLYSSETGVGTDIVITGDSFLDPVKDTPLAANGGWQLQSGKNAQLRVNGYPDSGWMELAGNNVNFIEGLSITLQSTGFSNVNVSLDVDKVRDNVVAFVEATNSLRSIINALTKVDAAKPTVDPDYANSIFEMQQGGVLTGNYGAQLIASKLKTAIMSKPAGFEYLSLNASGSVIGGDVIAALSHLGIKTDDQQGSPTYGLLIFEDNLRAMSGGVPLPTLEDSIAAHADKIAEFFAAKDKVSVGSDNFGYNSMVTGNVKAGSYDVSYEVAADGKLIPGTIFINGKAAKYYPAENQIMLVRGDGPDNDVDGVLFDIYNNTPTGGTPHTGSFGVKQGMLSGIINMVDVDFMDPDSGGQDKVKGTIPVLKSQYKNIIKNIDDKIGKEDERLTLWRRRMELRYANLDALLKNYADLQTQIESQIAQLSSGGSK